MEQNFKGKLQELLAQHHKVFPIYEEQEIKAQNGEQHFQTFQYTVSLGKFQKTGSGNSKKNAQQRAAELMLNDIKSSRIKLNSIPNANDYKEKKSEAPQFQQYQKEERKNFVGELQEFLVQNKKVTPTYDPVYKILKSENGQSFQCTVCLGTLQKTGSGKSKPEAKQAAAEKMLKNIKSMPINLDKIPYSEDYNKQQFVKDNAKPEVKQNLRDALSNVHLPFSSNHSQIKEQINYIGKLQELLVNAKKVDPKYEVQECKQNVDPFHCTVQVGAFQRTGLGPSKSEARQKAAAEMLRDIRFNIIDLNKIADKPVEKEEQIGMDPEHINLLREKRVDLLKLIVGVNSIIDGLFSRGIFTLEIKEEIEAKDTRTNRLRLILDVLSKRGREEFNAFYEVLVENREYDAADCLCPDLVDQRKARQMTSPSDLLSKSGDQKKILHTSEYDELPTDWPDPSKHDPLRIKVIKIPETEDGKQMKNLFEGAASGNCRIYPMLNSSRGIALIINNMNFQQARTANVNLEDRKGSEYDQMALDMLFEQLGFKRVIRKDCTVQEMLDAVCEQVSEAGSTHQDCFVFVVLSHGERDHVFGVDGEKVHLDKFEEAVDLPLLIDKPKLLFIQACQGDRGDTGIRHDGTKEISSQMPEVQKLHLREESDGASPKWVPSKADIFSAKATVPNYFSWRNVDWGTWFIQAVVFVFSNFAYKYDLANLMFMVNDLVKKAKAEDNFRQISTFTCSHTRTLYFFPGLTHSSPS